MTVRAHSRCWYCGATDLPRTDEHVLSERNFGGRLVSPDAVCESCNGLAGRIELMLAGHPFVAEAVAEYMTGAGRKAYPESRARLDDGAEVHVERRPSGIEIVARTPRQISTDDDGTEVWEVAAGQEDLFVERRRKRGENVRAVGQPLGPGGHMELSYGVGLANFALWPRFLAKVALGAMSLHAPDEWLDSQGARALQDAFHECARPVAATPYPLPFEPAEQDRSAPPWSAFGRGDHVLGFRRDEDTGATHFWLILFGYLAEHVEIWDFDAPEEPTWLVPCDGHSPVEFTGSAFQEWVRSELARP